MNNLLLYLIQANLSLFILYLIYVLVLRKHSHFRFNRLFLLFSVFSSFLIPLIDFSFLGSSDLFYFQLDGAQVVSQDLMRNQEAQLSIINILWFVYFFISGLLLLKLQLDLFKIYKLKKEADELNQANSSNIILLNSKENFSFFNWIFIRNEDRNNQAVIDHEILHARLFHSFDIILVKIFQSFFWFNPVLFLLEKELRLQHEYEVDRNIIHTYTSVLDYQQLLLNQVFGTEFNLITNQFNQSFLKNRFTMMTKKENKKRSAILLSLLFLVATLTPMLFSCSMEANKEEAQSQPMQQEVKSNTINEENPSGTTSGDASTDETFLVVEVMPQFPGGEKELYQYIGSHLTYPEEAKKEGIQGKVFVQFIIEKDGSISHVEIAKGIGEACDQAAYDVIANMPNWSPGKQRGENVRVQFRLPISFKLQ